MSERQPPEPLPVTITRLSDAVPLPAYQTPGSAGFDLSASADVVVEPGQVTLVPTGLVLAVPPGHFLGVFARSSTPLKRGLMVANGVGIVDADYCGPQDEVKIEVFNFTAAPVRIAAGDRLAQGVIIPFVQARWTETLASARPSRGGFGSTG